MDVALPARPCAGSAFYSRRPSELGVRCVFASLLERNSLCERIPRHVTHFDCWGLAVSKKRREDAHALQKSGICRAKPNSRVVDFAAFGVRNRLLITSL